MTDDYDADFLQSGSQTGAPSAWVGPARDALEDDATYAELPAGLEDLVVAAIAEEASAAQTQSTDQPTDSPMVVADELGARRRSKLSTPLLAAAAVVLAIAMFGAGLLAAGGGDENPEPEFALVLAATDLAPDASGEVEFTDTPSGIRVELSVEGLAPAAADTYYQGWLQTEDGGVTIGTFHLRGGDDEPVILWSGLNLADVTGMTVTLQTIDGGPASSGQVVLRVTR